MSITLEQALKAAYESVNQNRIKESLNILNGLERELGNHPDIHYGKYLVALKQKRYLPALAEISKAISLAPKHLHFGVEKIKLLKILNRQDELVDAFQTLWQTVKDHSSLLGLLRMLSDLKLPFVPLEYMEWAKAREFLTKPNNFFELESFLSLDENAIETNDRLLFLKDQAQCALNTGQTNRAIKYLESALNISVTEQDAIINLGTCYQRLGDFTRAKDLYKSVIQINNQLPEPHNNLGVIYKNEGNYSDAIAALKNAIEIKPEYSGAWNNLGLTYQLIPDLENAEISLREANELSPFDPEVLVNLGAVIGQQGRAAEARVFYEKAQQISPEDPVILTNIAVQEFQAKNFDRAKELYSVALSVSPSYLPAINNMAALLMETGDYKGAIDLLNNLLAKSPNYVDALNNIGISYRQINRLGEAKTALEKCLTIDPNHKEAISNLAFVYQDLGMFDKALTNYRKALAIDGHKNFWDNYLFCANYHPTLSQAEHFEIYKQYNLVKGRIDSPLDVKPRPYYGRKLKLGYVSGDLRKHPQEYFFMPFLDHHDRNNFEIYCFHNGLKEDSVSLEMKKKSDGWVRTYSMSSSEFARCVADLQIDILIDLAGHTSGNRADVYPYKAAPLQLSTLLGWNFGVGLDSIDALIGDDYTLPIGVENYSIEPILRIPCNSYVCRLSADLPMLERLPSLDRGYITFGTTTRSVRLNDINLNVWSNLLKEVPNSKLQFNSRNFLDPASIDRMKKFFIENGVDQDRLEFDFSTPINKAFSNIDIYLDTFPYNNGTTLVEALWYGLPVVTLGGRPPFGCIGSSILHYAGLDSWIAKSEQEYISIAKKLALSTDELARRRLEQRNEIKLTALFDELTEVRWYEKAYVAMYDKKLKELSQ